MVGLSQVMVRTRQDPRASIRLRQLQSLGYGVRKLWVQDVFTISGSVSQDDLERMATQWHNPIIQETTINQSWSPSEFDWCVEIGYLPGVTDNAGKTAEEAMSDFLGNQANGSRVFSSQQWFIQGILSPEEVQRLASEYYNPLIQRARIQSASEFRKKNGMGAVAPLVNIHEIPGALEVDVNVGDEELVRMGKAGIANADGTRRGPLALGLEEMKAIQSHFRELNRNPTDIELESLAQTWSEHCKHTIFASALGEIQEGLFKHYIQRATKEVREALGEKDFCVSVFQDNSGGIAFDENWIVTDKAETHNSPSALDPFGGAITGIVGVNRDAIGFGLGAKPIANRYGFCFADPKDETLLYRGKDRTNAMLSSKRILQGVVQGVNVGGNCSGIPTPQGFGIFDARFKGKPLVFVGTIGLIPKQVNGKPSWEKKAEPGDYIVMVGARVGLDGIHGATFSSEAMDSGSPASAVQLDETITQKKLSDALVKEARDLGLYHSMTDNGAGGLSCSVAEMAKECNGCMVDLEKVPTKYANMSAWQVWISESQNRMTLSVPKEKIAEFQELMKRRGVESTVIGTFTDSGKCVVNYHGKRIMDLDLQFLHDGVPPKKLSPVFETVPLLKSTLAEKSDYSKELVEMMGRLNVCSKEFIAMQYDHEVQSNSAIKPLQGVGRVQGNYSVIKPLLDSRKGVALGQGIFSQYSDISTYWMAAAGIDLAYRAAICGGAQPNQIALLDNFCWCSSTEPERLGQLERAARACYDFATAYNAPLISGKDSMFNDFKGYDGEGNPLKISVPPTLLASSIGIVEDVSQCVSMDLKEEGDIVYLIGETKAEMGCSEFDRMLFESFQEQLVGNRVPQIAPKESMERYRALSKAIRERLVASAHPLDYGGLAVGLAKQCIAGKKGMRVELHQEPLKSFESLFSESLGRIVVTIAPKNKKAFESAMKSHAKEIGVVTGSKLDISFNGKKVIGARVTDLEEAYKKTFRGF